MGFTKAFVHVAIFMKYKHLNLEPQTEDHWILDHRNGNLLGPFTGQAQAKDLGKKLNEFMRRTNKPTPITDATTYPFRVHENTGTLINF
jgi:hypothetical protein